MLSQVSLVFEKVSPMSKCQVYYKITIIYKTSLLDDNQNLYYTLFEFLQSPIQNPEVQEEAIKNK